MIAVIFLNKTKGNVAIPVCEALFDQFPSPEDFAAASLEDILPIVRPLGLQNKRAKLIIDLAHAWLEHPPTLGKRYRRLHYPSWDDGRDISKDEEPISDDDVRAAWEIAHLPGVGEYALDSWRIFCRDTLRGHSTGLKPRTDDGFAEEQRQEWTRVLPKDKELRAYLRWRWLRLRYLWNPIDGHKVKVAPEIVAKLENGSIKSYGEFKTPWLVDFPVEGEVLRTDSL